VTTFDPGPLGASGIRAPETVTQLSLHVDPGAITATVLRWSDNTVRVRLCAGGDVGFVLDAAQLAALRTMLADVLGIVYLAERRAA
jgi:hypothetical protein